MSSIISRIADALVHAHEWVGNHVKFQYGRTHINYHPFRMYVSFTVTIYSGPTKIQSIPLKVKITKDLKDWKLVDPDYDGRKEITDGE